MSAAINLNLGGGGAWKHDGWTNLEYDLGYDLARVGLTDFRTGSVSRIFCSHSLEHMPIESARRLVADCHRVLKPGGVLRLVLPDCEKFVRAWREGDKQFYLGNGFLTPHFQSEVDCLIHMGGNPESFEKPSKITHYFFWDRYSLTWLLVLAGFRTIHDSAFGESVDPVLRQTAAMDEKTGMPLTGFDNPFTKPISVYLEAVR
jgi:SAM-dependent methyltransferase